MWPNSGLTAAHVARRHGCRAAPLESHAGAFMWVRWCLHLRGCGQPAGGGSTDIGCDSGNAHCAQPSHSKRCSSTTTLAVAAVAGTYHHLDALESVFIVRLVRGGGEADGGVVVGRRHHDSFRHHNALPGPLARQPAGERSRGGQCKGDGQGSWRRGEGYNLHWDHCWCLVRSSECRTHCLLM